MKIKELIYWKKQTNWPTLSEEKINFANTNITLVQLVTIQCLQFRPDS